ncbi:MAG: hypothetical protein EYC62_02395 [Alphaproteobacteria bacterium]|nr:MAG: hypothetical protein EYC62_02395 [Alphaproteobacteria bacterium]
MSGLEIAAYIGLYALIVLVGFAAINAKMAKNADAKQESYIAFANENMERPRLGTGLGQSRPQSTYVKLSSQRKAG